MIFKNMEPIVETKWKIGDKFYGIVYYIVTANAIQRYLSFRLKPAEIQFEFYHRGNLHFRFGIMLKFMSLIIDGSFSI